MPLLWLLVLLLLWHLSLKQTLLMRLHRRVAAENGLERGVVKGVAEDAVQLL